MCHTTDSISLFTKCDGKNAKKETLAKAYRYCVLNIILGLNALCFVGFQAADTVLKAIGTRWKVPWTVETIVQVPSF